MASNVHNLGDLGLEFQLDLFNELIVDTKFGESVIETLENFHFKVEALQKILFLLKTYYSEHETIPTFRVLRTQINMEVPDSVFRLQLLEMVEKIENRNVVNKNVKNFVTKFCKMQALKHVLKDISSKVERGYVEEYDTIEKKLRDALVFKEVTDSITVFSDVDGVLSSDYRDPIATGIKGIDEILDGGLSKSELALVIAPLGVGKAQPLHSKIVTPKGLTTMGKIKVGDEVISSKGLPTKVVGVYPQEGLRNVYTVTFSDGSKTECDENHIWSVIDMTSGSLDTKQMSLSDIIKTGYIERSIPRFKIPVTKPVEFESRHVKMDPYTFGLLFATKYTNNKSIAVFNDKIVEHIQKTTNCEVETMDNCYVIKNIPAIEFININDYLYNSIEVRTSFLQGVMDFNCYLDEDYNCSYSTLHENMAKDIKKFILSLGGLVRITYTKSIDVIDDNFFKINFFIDNNQISLFRYGQLNNFFNPNYGAPIDRFIYDIEYKGQEPTQCIMIEDDSHEYLTDDYIVTHNTTFLTKIANQAYLDGRNVLQVFFEDKEKAIQRKHYTLFSGIELSKLSLPENIPIVKDKLIKLKNKIESSNRPKNHLFLQKMPADGVTVTKIKNLIKKINSKGDKIDLLVLDYVDCLSLEKEFYNAAGDEWSTEGKIMRLLESMVEEVGVACWTASQGNRSSTSLEVVKTENMGGSIKKGQIAHFIVGIGKTLEQKENKVATISILKNRMGEDGRIFPNCKFDNGFLDIDTSNQITEIGFENEKREGSLERVRAIYREQNSKKENN